MFLLEYIKNPRKVGAVAPSSRFLANKMLSKVDFESAKCIIEYGPGTGAFTEKLVARANENTKVILIEINKEFYHKLNRLYGHKKNVLILNESAENIDDILKRYNIEKVDYIVSGLPFASLPKEVSDKILTKTAEIIENSGEFITFQYSLVKKSLFDRFFEEICTDKTYMNIPPAYVLRCRS
ncbi:rRNA adenine N-6-methyltransferase family protein [uncultured Clostridium sp.]|jgi:phospholipid N-methyltransferase|uniref:class I SAM-dependent methyltransferase n=1 Tax=uncultured Clostridium sp. TaxID=59620 RepID=UPI002621E0A4|nr:rRNA adenine N-6-methyltransferase family protein [uncultured Clostridium sp.]